MLLVVSYGSEADVIFILLCSGIYDLNKFHYS